MQRKQLKYRYPIIKRIYPRVFWHDCDFCKNEFKKEMGFKILDKKACFAFGEDPIRTFYCCSKCANTEQDVMNLISKRKLNFLFDRPSLSGGKKDV